MMEVTIPPKFVIFTVIPFLFSRLYRKTFSPLKVPKFEVSIFISFWFGSCELLFSLFTQDLLTIERINSKRIARDVLNKYFMTFFLNINLQWMNWIVISSGQKSFFYIQILKLQILTRKITFSELENLGHRTEDRRDELSFFSQKKVNCPENLSSI